MKDFLMTTTALLMLAGAGHADTLPSCEKIDKGGYFTFARGCAERDSRDTDLVRIVAAEEPEGEGEGPVDPEGDGDGNGGAGGDMGGGDGGTGGDGDAGDGGDSPADGGDDTAGNGSEGKEASAEH
ncbi:MAG: hypothetical protein U5N55_11950 [Cypionkella sp.]|nr:hypothetical protein [Cypionkella sp.]